VKSSALRFNAPYCLAIGLILAIIAFLIYYSYQSKLDREDALLKSSISTLEISYQGVLKKYSHFTSMAFEYNIDTAKKLELLYRGSLSKGDEQNMYRGLLYREVYPLFEELKLHNISHLHFHLRDNTSFLRVQEPTKSGDFISLDRAGVHIANRDLVHVSGFGGTTHPLGFKNIWPIFYKDQHIGSVGFSYSIRTMLEALSELSENRIYTIRVNKEMMQLKEKNRYLFEQCKIHSGFMISDPHQALDSSPAPIPKEIRRELKKVNSKLSSNKSFIHAIDNSKIYATSQKIESGYYIVSLIPLLGADNSNKGFLVSYEKSADLEYISTLFYRLLLLAVVAGMTLITLVLIARRRSKDALWEKEWSNSIIETLGDGLYVTNSKNIIERVNSMACSILGFSREEMISKDAGELFDFSENPKSSERVFTCKENRSISVEVVSTEIVKDDRVIQVVNSFKDIGERKRREADIAYFAFYDALTDLPNRRLLGEYLGQISSSFARTHKTVAILFLDLDRFKLLNDTYGHEAGDELLIQLSSRFKRLIRKQDIVARLGGDEFIIVLDGMPDDLEQAKKSIKIALQKIEKEIKRPFDLGELSYTAAASIGVYMLNDDLLSVGDILKYADAALYRAKELGRDRAYFYDDIDQEIVEKGTVK